MIKDKVSRYLMPNQYTAVIKNDRDWWIGWIEEIPGVNCQEKTKEDLLISLKSTLIEALVLNREDALSAAGEDFKEIKIAL